MTVPTPIRQRIRILDARGVSWRRISKEVGVPRQTVRKYAQLEDCSPEPPARPAAVSKLDPYKPLIGKWLEADRFMPRKQRHTARRVYDRLVAEQGFDGSYQIVQRYVKRWRQEHRLPGDGYPGVGVVAGRDAGGFRFGAGRGGGEPDGRALPGGVVPAFEHAVRGGVARGERGVRVRGAARGVRAHRRRAAGAGARTTPPARRTGSRGTGSWWWRCSRGSSRITGSRPGVRDPGAGNEKGGEGERGRVPAPQRDGAVAERRVACAAGGGSCSPGATGSPRIPITARASRSGTCSRGIGRRWPRCLEPGSTRAGGRCARPTARDARAWTRTVISRVRRGAGGRSTSGCARSTRGIRTRDGRRVGKLPRAYGGDTGTVRDPAVLLPALARKPRAWGESPIRADFPDRLRLSIDAMESRERQRTLRLIHRASESAGFDAAAVPPNASWNRGTASTRRA